MGFSDWPGSMTWPHLERQCQTQLKHSVLGVGKEFLRGIGGLISEMMQSGKIITITNKSTYLEAIRRVRWKRHIKSLWKMLRLISGANAKLSSFPVPQKCCHYEERTPFPCSHSGLYTFLCASGRQHLSDYLYLQVANSAQVFRLSFGMK